MKRPQIIDGRQFNTGHGKFNGDGLARARRCRQAGDFAQAEYFYQLALVADCEQPDVWCALGEVRQRLAKRPEANAAYENALRLQPGCAEAYLGLAEVHKDQGRLADAASAYQQALRSIPDQADTLTNLGVVLAQLGRVDEALEYWQRVLHLQPDCAKVVHNVGVALAQKGNHEDAIQYLEKALALKPDYAEACFNLGNVLVSAARRPEALPHFQEALRLRPDYADAYHNLGCALTELRRYPEATVFLNQLLRLRPDFAEGYNQLGLALAAQGKYAEAEASYREALRLNPASANAHSNLGNACQEQGRLDEALACYQLALWIEPGSVSSHWNRALALLQKGDFERGWKEYEWRWQRQQTPARPFGQPRWDGSPLDGRTILLYLEQGLGDSIMFIRYAALVKERAAMVLVECPDFLIPLLSRCPGIDRVVAEGTQLPHFDAQAPLLSLPHLLGTTLATVPACIPYLFADENLVDHWRQRLAEVEGFKIGILWQGNPRHGLDHYRSIPLEQFTGLATIPGVRLVSLQRGAGREQLAQTGQRLGVVDFGDALDQEAGAFMDTAALMQSLDLVISVDTAVAHLAGALGVPVWVPMHAIGEWRWLLKHEDSPWYPSLRLFRQAKLGDWDPVFERMAAEIHKRISGSPVHHAIILRDCDSP